MVERLSHDIVVATRNRPLALKLSIPLFLNQSRLPGRLIIVDSSDDHEEIRRLAQGAVQGQSVELHVLRSERGSALQRNAGLELVRAPVAFFPDDDSLWLPGVAEAILSIYERDRRGDIGAVCAAESPQPPEGVLAHAEYRMTTFEKVKQRIAHRRAVFERAFFPDPFITHGRSCSNVRPTPSWLPEEDAVLVEWMTGFRMSFRTDLIRRFRFDEILGNYALFEDVEASFQVMRSHLVVGARKAKVYHYKAPGGRGSALALGATQVLNRAYVICKHAASGSAARRALRWHGLYKAGLYLLGCHKRSGRERLLGAWRASRLTNRLLAASPQELPEEYLRVRRLCLGEGQDL